MLLRTLALGFVLLCSGGSALAANLIVNPDFTHDTAAWSLVGAGTMSLDPAIGVLVAPSMLVGIAAGSSAATVATDCMRIEAAAIDFHVATHLRDGSAVGIVVLYGNADCTHEIGRATTPTAVPSDFSPWYSVGFHGYPVPDGMRSARVELTVNGASDAANFDQIAFGPTDTVFGGIPLAQEGLTGAWYNPAASGQGFQFSIVPDAATGATSVFGAWYTFGLTPGGVDTQRWYSVQAVAPRGAREVQLTIYQNVGGTFDAPPSTTATRAGTAVLSFWSCTSGVFDYTLDDGRIGSIVIQSLLPSVGCSETQESPPPPGDFGLSGAWYEPATTGQGLIVNFDPVGNQVFGGWFTYAFTGSGETGVEAQRWFSLQGAHAQDSRSVDLVIYAVTFGTFVAGGAGSTEAVGTATLSYTDCTTATLDYAFDADFGGTEGHLDLVRLGPMPESCAIDD
ncbi:MAG TPA: hypothetical protein VKB52_10960 [Rhodanobacteraceae bacterium]|nr:hypothetical protein [Rhodanobacteraceae bacterium]